MKEKLVGIFGDRLRFDQQGNWSRILIRKDDGTEAVLDAAGSPRVAWERAAATVRRFGVDNILELCRR